MSSKKRPLFNIHEKEEDESVKVEYITGISGNEFQSSQPKAPSIPLVIPLPPQNKSSNLPEKYQGLLKKPKLEPTTTPSINQNNDYHQESALELPLMLKYRNSDLDGIEDEGIRFKIDVNSRPDEASFSSYDKIPVAEFGEALLRGMGWAPGKPVGLTNAKVVEPIEFLRKGNARSGLGAKDDIPAKPPKKFIKPGESREKPEPQVLPENVDGIKRHVRSLDEKLVPLSKASGIYQGATVYIIKGKHDGLKGRILEMIDEELIIKLSSSEVDVKVHKSYVSPFQPKESSNSKREFSNSQKESSSSSSSSSSWLYPHLIVRIISKSFSNGKYYLRKGFVVDIIDKTKCTVKVLNSDSLVDIKFDMLETVIPKEGQKVMIVSGKYKGQLGKLISSNKTNASVQLNDDLSIHSFDLDSVCSYEGSNEY